MANTKDTRTSQLNTNTFWRIIVPVVVLLLLLFTLFVVYSMPDWALDCPANGGLTLRSAVGKLSTN
jgi:hypothetical protein